LKHEGWVAQDLTPQVFRDFGSSKRHGSDGALFTGTGKRSEERAERDLHCLSINYHLSTINQSRKSAVDLTSVAHYKVRAS
jgi:hypothetical protein